MSAVGNNHPQWMCAQPQHLKYENYKFSKKEKAAIKETFDNVQKVTLGITLTQIGACTAVGAAVVPGIGAVPGALIGAGSVLLGAVPYGCAEIVKSQKDVFQVSKQRIFRESYAEATEALTDNFQEAHEFICPVSLCLPSQPVRIAGERQCYQRDALIEHTQNNGLFSPMTRAPFREDQIIPAHNFHAKVGKMCHKILSDPKRSQTCSIEQLKYLEAFRSKCNNYCSELLKKESHELDRRLQNKEITPKKYHREVANLAEEIDPSLAEAPSDEEKED